MKLHLQSLDTLTTFETVCVNLPESKNLLSQMYKLVLSAQSTAVPYYIREWERELVQDFNPLQIHKMMIRLTHAISISSRVQEMAYKFLTRWYRTPSRIAQMSPMADACFWKGCSHRCTFFHLWWFCPKIKIFWEAITPWIKKKQLLDL